MRPWWTVKNVNGDEFTINLYMVDCLTKVLVTDGSYRYTLWMLPVSDGAKGEHVDLPEMEYHRTLGALTEVEG